MPKKKILKAASTMEASQLIRYLMDDINEIEDRGWGECKICGRRFYGDFEAILERVGSHGCEETNETNN